MEITLITSISMAVSLTALCFFYHNANNILKKEKQALIIKQNDEKLKKEREISQEIEEENKPVPCETCKCLINKSESYKVTKNASYFFYLSRITLEYFYCQKCKPNYTRIERKKDIANALLVDKFFKELEVTEQGEPVGYIKKK